MTSESGLLIGAVEKGDLSKVRELLDKGADIEIKGLNNETPLCVASRIGNLDIVQLLLSRGANVNVQDDNGKTPLHYAVEIDRGVELILDKNPSLGAMDKRNGWTPLHYTAWLNRSNAASLLLGRNADIEAKDGMGRTPLIVASYYGVLDVARILLDRGANVNARANDGRTSLHHAPFWDELKLVKLLLDRGANIRIKDKYNITPLEEASRGIAQVGKAKYLRDKQSEYNGLLFAAVGNGNVDQVTDLLGRGADIEARGLNNETPLCVASRIGNLNVIQLLLSRNANVNAQDDEGKTPLHHAAYYAKGIELILNNGPNIEAQDKNGWTPLHYAAWQGQLDAAKLLVGGNANILAKNKEDKTPLDVANEFGKTELANFFNAIMLDRALFNAVQRGDVSEVTNLLDRGANIEVKGLNNETPLCVASRVGNLNVIQLLLNRNANVNAQDDEGKTPLHHAAYYAKGRGLILGKDANLDIARLLVGKNANILAKDKDGKAPLDVANEFGKTELANFLKESLDRALFIAVVSKNINEVANLLDGGANIEARGLKKETPLCLASRTSGLDVIQLLLSKNANINVQDDDGRTPLHHTAYYGKGIELILNSGPNIEAKDKGGWTPLHYAAWQGQLDAAKLLVGRNANIVARNKEDKTPLDVASEFGKAELVSFFRESLDSKLFTAVERGDVSEVTNLLDGGANIEARGLKKETPLCLASRTSGLDVIQLLLSKNANINVQDDDGRTPLHHTAYYGKGIELILNNGPNIEAQDKNGWTPLHYAAQQGHLETVRFLVDKGANITIAGTSGEKPIHVAAQDGKKDVIEFLLDRGVSVNDVNTKIRWTPLHYAAQQGHLETVRFLVDKGANITIADIIGEKPIHVAAQYGGKDVIEFLLSKNVSVNDINNENKWTPLHYAAQAGYLEAARFLVDKGANITIAGASGKKPIHVAAQYGGKDVIEFLLSKNVSVNDVNTKTGWTPLHYAAQQGHLETVRFLIDKGADIEAKEKNGLNALHESIYYNRLDVFKLLVRKGANINAKDGNDETPLEVARRFGRPEIINFLIAKQSEGRVQRGHRHHHGDHTRHHSGEQKYLQRKERSVHLELEGASRSVENNNPTIENNQATSGASKPFSLIDTFANTIVDAGKGVFQFISSPLRSAIDSQVGNTSKVVPEIKNISAQSDINGAILLFDVLLAKKGRRQIYTPSVDKQVSSLEAQAYALNIVNEFEPILKQAALRCGISQLKVDFQELHSSILKKIMAGDYRGVSDILYSVVEKACPALEQKKKFSMSFKGKIEQMLQKEMMPLLDKGNIDPLSLSTNKTAALPSPRTNLNNISVTNNSTELIR